MNSLDKTWLASRLPTSSRFSWLAMIFSLELSLKIEMYLVYFEKVDRLVYKDFVNELPQG